MAASLIRRAGLSPSRRDSHQFYEANELRERVREMKIEISVMNHTRGRINIAALNRRLRQVLKELRVKACQWSVNVVDDCAMMELHKRTMDIGTTTDVLTFDMRDARGRREKREGAAVELDTVVCRDEAVRRAKEMGVGVDDELLLYAVHSLLHVQGYDDLTARGAQLMHQREDELLEALGVGAVYDPQARAKGGDARARRPA